MTSGRTTFERCRGLGVFVGTFSTRNTRPTYHEQSGVATSQPEFETVYKLKLRWKEPETRKFVLSISGRIG